MSDHSSSVFNNSCIKAPRRPSSDQPFPICEQKQLNQLKNQARKLEDRSNRPKSALSSFLDFYDSIPEYDDVNHLSNKEFYRRLENLREKQRIYKEKLELEEKVDWREAYGNLSRKTSASSGKPPSRRSVRIETPSEQEEKKGNWEDSSVDDLQVESKSAPASPVRSKSSVGWKDTITIPQPFQMTVRDEENKIVEQVLIKTKKINKEEKSEMFRAHPVPIESQIPLFDKIMADQEKRSDYVKKKRKAELISNMKPFSFTKRDEELQALTKRLSKSSPSVFLDSPPLKIKQFKAKPIPKNLFSNYIYKKMHEDEFYRALQRKIRAEEMLKAASLPPSMEKRQKRKPKDEVCPRLMAELKEERLEKEFEELRKEFLNEKKKKKKKQKRSYSASSTVQTTPDLLPLEAISRKRMEMEMCRRLEEARLKDEARWKEKVMRRRPVWQGLAYSQEEDLAMRLQQRRDEARLRSEEHRQRMQIMLGRVNRQPTLFERQSQYANKGMTSQQLLDSLLSDSSDKKSLTEMKDESIQALDEEIEEYLKNRDTQTDSDNEDGEE